MNKKAFILIIIGVILALFLVYRLAYDKGKKDMQVNYANNASIIKEIAELAALDVQGNTTINVSNKSDDRNILGQLKNLLAENTMNISLPYEAKYGIDLSKQEVNINTKDSTVTIFLPEAKLLSLQLRMDKIQGISRTGLFYSQSLDDYMKVHQKMYEESLKTLENNSNYKNMAQNHIRDILTRYYSPLGLKVNCVFGKSNSFSTSPKQ